jgi:hypothetical protein
MIESLSAVEWARVRAWISTRSRSKCDPQSKLFRRNLAIAAKNKSGGHPVSRQIAREALRWAKED